MDMIFESFESIHPRKITFKQLHGVLLKYSSKDHDHRGHYKKVQPRRGFWSGSQEPRVVFETATPFVNARMDEGIA